jgi:hypothetical protein
VTTSDDEASKRLDGSVYRGEPENCPNGNEHRVTIFASYTAANGLTVRASEFASWPCDDLECTYSVAPAHIGGLRTALGASDDDDLVELLAQRYADGTISPGPYLGAWLKHRGVEYSASETWHPN